MACALVLWLFVLVLLTGSYFLTPGMRNITGVYHDASSAWLSGNNLYHGYRIFNYSPQFAILFAPFHLVGPFVGDLLWRWVSLGLLVGGWWRLAKLLNRQHAAKIFFWSSLFALAACGDAIRNGQANVILSAFLLWSTCFLIERRWWSAAGSLALGLTKPLGVVMFALAPFGFPSLVLPLVAALGTFTLIPFAFHPPDYVFDQFFKFLDQLVYCSTVTTTILGLVDHRFADINGLLRLHSLKTEIPVAWSLWIRLSAGALVLGVWWRYSRRLDSPVKEMFLLSLATVYVMLFNPMNEVNTYVLLAPVCGLFAGYLYEVQGLRRAACLVYAIVGSIGILPELVRRISKTFALWWDPLMAMVFLAVVLWLIGKLHSQRPQEYLAHRPAPVETEAIG